MGQTEQKIKIESDIFALKRDYKYALENLSKIKTETAEIIAIKDKVTKEVEEKQAELTEVLNKISQEKLDLANHRHSELVEIENKQAEVQNVLNWKADLNKKEEEIRKIEANDIEVRNETRRLELKVENAKTALEAKERALVVREVQLEEKGKKVIEDMKDFKKRVFAILSEVEKL